MWSFHIIIIIIVIIMIITLLFFSSALLDIICNTYPIIKYMYDGNYVCRSSAHRRSHALSDLYGGTASLLKTKKKTNKQKKSRNPNENHSKLTIILIFNEWIKKKQPEQTQTIEMNNEGSVWDNKSMKNRQRLTNGKAAFLFCFLCALSQITSVFASNSNRN